MSFTQSELQSFSLLLDQKLAQQRRELERSFDQRMQIFKRDVERRLLYTQQELTRVLAQGLSEQQRKLKELLGNELGVKARYASIPTDSIGREQLLEEAIEHAFETQLASLDQLISQRFAFTQETSSLSVDGSSEFADIEVQTEIPWDELADAVNKALDERFTSLHDSLKDSVRALERYFSDKVPQLLKEAVPPQVDSHGELSLHATEIPNVNGTLTSMQDVFSSLERLEHIIEAMQVTMTSNHALLSNRIYHHQQLPLERVHVSEQDAPSQSMNTPLARGLRPAPKEKDRL